MTAEDFVEMLKSERKFNQDIVNWQHKIVVSWHVFNYIEFGTIKIFIVQQMWGIQRNDIFF